MKKETHWLFVTYKYIYYKNGNKAAAAETQMEQSSQNHVFRAAIMKNATFVWKKVSQQITISRMQVDKPVAKQNWEKKV